jgi:choline-sulfatase
MHRMSASRTTARIRGVPSWSRAAVLCAATWSANCQAITPVPDSLVLITLDTTRADRLPAYGFQGVSTPALDRLAAEGIVFEDAVAPVPLTLPSHASLLTGRWPTKHGIRDNADAALAPAELTLAEVLRDRGVRTGAFVASVVLQSGRGLEQGFGTYVDVPKRSCGNVTERRRPGDAVVDDVMAWIDQNAERPFFTWVHLYDAHRPYHVPEAYANRHGDPYLDAIAFQDSQVARIVQQLESRRLLDRTIVVVAADHGESLGEHSEDGHGIFLYESTLRVPLIMRVPYLQPRRVSSTARLVDLMPTVLDLLHVPVPVVDGVSLAGMMTQGGAGMQLEAYSESVYPERFGWSRLRSLRGDRYKLIDAPRPELYDLQTDPFEQRNLYAENPRLAGLLRQRLARFEAPTPERERTSVAVGADHASRLTALGYVGTPTPTPTLRAGEAWPDPKDTIREYNAIVQERLERSARAGLSDPGGCSAHALQ